MPNLTPTITITRWDIKCLHYARDLGEVVGTKFYPKPGSLRLILHNGRPTCGYCNGPVYGEPYV